MVSEFKAKTAEQPKSSEKPPEPAKEPEPPQPAGLPYDLAKQESYYSNLYGPAKSERKLKSYSFTFPNYASQIEVEQPFVLREYTTNRLTVRVLFSEATGQAVWAQYSMLSWKEEEVESALKAYGSGWRKTRLNLAASLMLPDNEPALFRSAAGIAVYKTLLNDLIVYAPQLYTNLNAQVEEQERQRKLPAKF